MGDENSGPHTGRYKQTGHNRRNDTDDHNALLTGRRIKIDNHRGGQASLRKATSNFKKARKVTKDPRTIHKYL